MAVAFDAVGPSSAGATSSASTTLSWTHTNVGSGVALFVAIACGKIGDTGITMTVALDPSGANTAFTSLGTRVQSNGGTDGFVHLFGLPNTSSGAHTVTATASGGTPGTLEGGSISYTGAHLTTPFSAQQSVTGSGDATPGITFTGSTSGNMVAAALVNGNSVTSISVGTSRWIRNVDGLSAGGNAASADTAAGGSVTVEWNATADWFGVAAVEILVASAGPSPAPTNLVVYPQPIQRGF